MYTIIFKKPVSILSFKIYTIYFYNVFLEMFANYTEKYINKYKYMSKLNISLLITRKARIACKAKLCVYVQKSVYIV